MITQLSEVGWIDIHSLPEAFAGIIDNNIKKLKKIKKYFFIIYSTLNFQFIFNFFIVNLTTKPINIHPYIEIGMVIKGL